MDTELKANPSNNMSDVSVFENHSEREDGSGDANEPTGNKLKLHLEIDTAVLSSRPSDNLCIARKVNGVFNVVLLGASINPTGLQTQLQVHNTFTWEDAFRAFLAKDFMPQVIVSKSSNARDIEFGQQVVYNSKTSQLDKAIPADVDMFTHGDQGERSAEDSFILARVPSWLRGASECRVGDGGDNDSWYPMYVDPGRHPTTTDLQVTPSNEYVIFWDAYLTPNAAFLYYPRSEKKTFSFPSGTTEISIRFGWKSQGKPSQKEEPGFYMM